MSSSQDADSHDLSLPDLDDDFNLKSGPRIDSSDEFPLPSFDLEEGISPDILFPIEDLPEKTSEELPKPKQKVIPDITAPSLDADHFEFGLDEYDFGEPEVRKTTPLDETTRVTLPPLKPPPAPAQKDAPAPPPAPVQRAAPSELAEAMTRSQGAGQPVPDFSQKVKRQDLTPPGPPATTLNEIFFDDEPISAPSPKPAVKKVEMARENPPPPKVEKQAVPTPKAEKPPVPPPPRAESALPPPIPVPTSAPKAKDVSRAEWAEEVPVDQFVRQVKVKRKEAPPEPKFRPWVPAVGAALVAVAFFGSKPLFAGMSGSSTVDPVLVVGSLPQGEVFQGDTSLGQAPLSITAEQLAAGTIEIRRPGFESVAVKATGEKPEKVEKFYTKLSVAPVALSWEGLPKGSVLWWNGQKTEPSKLGKVNPGSYKVKVKAPDRPAVSFAFKVEPRGSKAGPLSMQNRITDALAKQPQLEVSLKMPDDKLKAKDLSLGVKGLGDGNSFSSSLKVSHDKRGKLVFPGPGKYKVSFAGNDKFKAVSQTVNLAEGASESISLALAKQPPRPVARPATTTSPSYQPSRPTYRPYRPTYRPSRPSGGGGRIAPPSF